MSDKVIVEKIIRDRSDIFESHFAASDAAGLVRDYYVESPAMSAPDAPLLRSRAEIEELFTAIMAQFSGCRLKQELVVCSGDLAYEVSSAFLTPRDGTDTVECRYMIAWRRCDDTWRVEMDFFAFGSLL